MTEASFGSTILGVSAAELLAREAAAGRAERFTTLDDLLAASLARAFSGERLVDVTYGKRGVRTDGVSLEGLGAVERSFLDEHYRIERQEARGAWFVPQETSLKVGLCNLPGHLAVQPRFVLNVVRDEIAKVDLRTSPHALPIWALLIPMFSELLAPLDLRTATGKVASPDQQRRTWASIEAAYVDLGLDLNDELKVFRYGGDWSRLRVDEQVAAKHALVAGLARQLSRESARRWRARKTQALVATYYRKAARGQPLARSVLTKGLQSHLSGFFTGDWLAFLDYLGERPSHAERIITALPEPRLYVGTASRTAKVAAEHGLLVDEVARMLGAFLGKIAGVSPVEERVTVMRRWWEAYDRIHAAQRPGAPSLWGLVDGGIFVLENPRGPTTGLYRRLLPADLTAEIDRLWDGVTLPRWPERIVSEFHPHRQMAEAFGPALEFWNGLALTCWFVCEGPSSRTTLGALGKYYHREIAALDTMGFPIDQPVFSELEKAERRLGPVEQLWETEETHADRGVTIRMGGGERRDGFEILRDIVTRHRRAWGAKYLNAYLHHRWENELRDVANEYNRRLAVRGKPPTFRQFASFAAPAANHWFGGDLAAVFASLGEKSPAPTARIDLLSGEPLVFAQNVYAGLGGGPPLPPQAVWRDHEAYKSQWELGRLAAEALRFLQLHEALGRPPTAREFGADRFLWDELGGQDIGFEKYVAVIEEARTASASPAASSPPAPPADTGKTAPQRPSSAVAQPAASARQQPAAPGRRGLLDRLRGR